MQWKPSRMKVCLSSVHAPFLHSIQLQPSPPTFLHVSPPPVQETGKLCERFSGDIHVVSTLSTHSVGVVRIQCGQLGMLPNCHYTPYSTHAPPHPTQQPHPWPKVNLVREAS
jgi:hypothetical protein